MNKEYLAIIGVVLTFVSYLPYIWSVWQGKTVPHAFSWIIWGVLSAICAAVQVAGGSGGGAWTTCSSACFCLLIAGLAAARSGLRASRNDWLTFGAGLAAIPLWYATSNPLWALLLLIGIESTAFWLTLKKGWFHPGEEMAFSYAVYAIATLLALLAVQTYNFITIAYPVFIITGNVAITLVVLGRRQGVRYSGKIAVAADILK